jgi:threonine dehydratase
MHEFLNQIKEDYQTHLDAVLVPVGGGGLLAGCAVACIGSGTRIFGSEPLLADDCARGIRQGFKARLDNYIPTGTPNGPSTTNQATPLTIADGLRTEVGNLNFPIIQEYVEQIFTVTELQIAKAMRIAMERLKVLVEPSAAVAVAVVLFNEEFRDIVKKDGIKNVGVVIEGGNVDTGSYERMMPWIHLEDAHSK